MGLFMRARMNEPEWKFNSATQWTNLLRKWYVLYNCKQPTNVEKLKNL